MSNNKDLFGGSDLFSYFGGNFSSPAPSKQEETSPTSEANEILASSATTDQQEGASWKEGIGPCPRKKSSDACLDVCDGEEEKAAIKEDEKAGQKKTTKNEKKPVFNQATYICYAGINRPLTKFFTEDLALVTLEDVRKRLEKDHPELSKQRTKMEWDEKKNAIIPIVTGGKKGAWFSEESRAYFASSAELYENLHPINILAGSDGFYEVRENPIGVFVVRKSAAELRGWRTFNDFYEYVEQLKHLEECREGFKLYLPKIPTQLFLQLISFFSDYADHEVEVMGVFYWNSEERQYILDIPYQNVTKVSVEPCYNVFPDYIKVAEVHSHHSMRAYFSSVDDSDELGTMLYGVVGKLKRSADTIRFDVRTRAGVAGKFIPLLPSVWIDCEYDNQDYSWNLIPYTPYPEKWRSRVVIGGNQL